MRRTRPYASVALMVALVAMQARASVVSELPTAGCYQTDWSARHTIGSGAGIQRTMLSTIDGATGTQKTIITGFDGKGFTTTAPGTGPVKRMLGQDGQWVEPYCPTQMDNNGQGRFEFKMTCETFTVDPAKLTFTKINGPIEKWSIAANLKMTSQVGLNNLPAAQRDMMENLKRAHAHARPRTAAERAQVEQQAQALKKLEIEMKKQAPAADQVRLEMEAISRSGTAEEQGMARMVLDGPVIEQNTEVTEILTWAGSEC